MGSTLAPSGSMPAAVTADLRRLRRALHRQIPAKSSRNLLIGTWNLRAFGGITSQWHSRGSDRPARDWHALSCIATVLRRFDVVALQEGRRDTTALFALLHKMGSRFRVLASDVTEGSGGNGERLAFVYDSQRVQPSGLVGELVLPPRASGGVDQFARTPYAAGFVRRDTDFILTTVHVLWGSAPEDRIGEIAAFAEWMRAWAARPDDWNRNLLVLGDFNLDRTGDPLFEAFVSTGLWPPAELNAVPRTIFDAGTGDHFYDQIAWFSDPSKPDLPSFLDGLTYTHRGGSFDFVPLALRGFSKPALSWRISDHYPLWVEFAV